MIQTPNDHSLISVNLYFENLILESLCYNLDIELADKKFPVTLSKNLLKEFNSNSEKLDSSNIQPDVNVLNYLKNNLFINNQKTPILNSSITRCLETNLVAEKVL
jgi:hypothetical protein